MDKLREDSRKKFEWWFNKEMVLHISECDETAVRLMWESWQASRASIVVELPKSHHVSDGRLEGEMVMLSGVIDSLRSIGISIKGE